MIIKNRKKHHPPVCRTGGPCLVDTSLPALERFLKDEISLMKTCGCAHCDYRRQMFRAMQYIINDYKKEREFNCNCCPVYDKNRGGCK